MSNTFLVQCELTIPTATAQLAEGIVALNKGTSEFDFSALREMDSTALALILAWRREAERLGKRLHCINLPENLKNLAALYGVENYISA